MVDKEKGRAQGMEENFDTIRSKWEFVVGEAGFG